MRFLSSLTLFLLFLPFSLWAANPLDVVVNEVAWMGTKVEGVESKNWWRYEWLELYNNTEQPISLEDWKIELYRTGLDWALGLKGVIPAKNYFLIVASDKIFSNYDLNYSNLGGKLNNNGQKILLKDSFGNVIDEVDCYSTGKWFAGDNSTKQTMERKSSLSESDSDNWGMGLNPGGTPKTKNSLTSQTPPLFEEGAEVKPPQVKEVELVFPIGVIINEILPSPEGSDAEEEWIEIFNQNGFEVDLSGWQITDTIGSAKIYTFLEGKKISSQGFLVLPRPETKITLNNNEDGLKFIQPDGKIIDEVGYKDAVQGKSFNRIESGWVWSNTLTPSSANVITETASKKTEELISEGKIKSEKELLEISGPAQIFQEEILAKKSFLPFLVASILAVFSGIIILILKKRLEIRYNKKI